MGNAPLYWGAAPHPNSAYTVTVGTKLIFRYPILVASVWLMPDYSAWSGCDFSSGAIELASPTYGRGSILHNQYEVVTTRAGTLHFACIRSDPAPGNGAHCRLGQRTIVTVVDSPPAPPQHCLCETRHFREGNVIPGWGGTRNCNQGELNWACQRPIADSGRTHMYAHCCDDNWPPPPPPPSPTSCIPSGGTNIVMLNVTHAVTWAEAFSQASSEANGLPTCNELRLAGVTAGSADLWMPVIRSDGQQEDYCQIGVHPSGRGPHVSHIDAFGPTSWHSTNSAAPYRPGPSAAVCTGNQASSMHAGLHRHPLRVRPLLPRHRQIRAYAAAIP